MRLKHEETSDAEISAASKSFRRNFCKSANLVSQTGIIDHILSNLTFKLCRFIKWIFISCLTLSSSLVSGVCLFESSVSLCGWCQVEKVSVSVWRSFTATDERQTSSGTTDTTAMSRTLSCPQTPRPPAASLTHDALFPDVLVFFIHFMARRRNRRRISADDRQKEQNKLLQLLFETLLIFWGRPTGGDTLAHSTAAARRQEHTPSSS